MAAMQLSHPQMPLLQAAFVFILIGAVFDFFDGFVARLLGVSGPLGIQLDSLADVVTFGVAPSMMIFTMFTQVRYPELIYSHFWFVYLPYTAFLLAAFSAMRLAKFNIDERQHTGFIGLPTPACAIFWGALISSSADYLRSPHFNAPFLLAFTLMFCFLLVCEIPMFAMKFKSYSWADTGNRIKYISLVNLIADAPVVVELIQQDFTAQRLEQEFQRILADDSYRQSVLDGYARVHSLLGNAGASDRTAAEIIKRIAHK
jgi:CDP-diacylglycerol--serine O-phosphatidyltransferase